MALTRLSSTRDYAAAGLHVFMVIFFTAPHESLTVSLLQGH